MEILAVLINKQYILLSNDYYNDQPVVCIRVNYNHEIINRLKKLTPDDLLESYMKRY